MKKFFYLGLIGLLLFEIIHVYFIMPMPGSQQFNTLPLAYFLHCYRWLFRVILGLAMALGLLRSQWKNKPLVALSLIALAAMLYDVNFVMAADGLFKQPKTITLVNVQANKVDPNLVKYFCSYGIDLSCTDYRDVSVLHAAAWNPSSTADVFQTLIDYGVNIN